MFGKNPSLRLCSRRRISSTDVAFAIASLTRAWSSFDMSRPAFAVVGAAFGSSVATARFAASLETVAAIFSASAFGTPSAVVKSALAASRSYNGKKRRKGGRRKEEMMGDAVRKRDARRAKGVGEGKGRTHLVPDSLEIQNSQRRNPPRKPLAVPFLFPHWVSKQREILEPADVLQRLEVAEFGDRVVGEDQCLQRGCGEVE